MKKIICLIYCLIIFQHFSAFSQSDIDNDNISVLEFYVPKLTYRINKVKEVSVFFELLPNKKELIEHSFYDNDGYLTYQEKYNDKKSTDKESIKVERRRGEFEVIRRISKKTLMNSATCKNCFWQSYNSIQEYWNTDNDSLITVKSIYSFSKDSGFNYKTFVNKKKVSDGYMVTGLNSDSELNYKRNSVVVDTFFSADTMQIRNEQKTNKVSRIITTNYLVNNVILKSEEKQFSEDSSYTVVYFIYSYDSNGKLHSVDYYDVNGRLWKKKSFYYENQVVNFTTEKKYQIDGTLISANKFDKDGKIVEELYYGVSGKAYAMTLYKYLPNGLVSEKSSSYEGVIKSRYTFSYDYE